MSRIAQVINEQKGALTALQCLIISVLRALPREQQARALQEFDLEREIARTGLLNSELPDEVLRGFDALVGAIELLRSD